MCNIKKKSDVKKNRDKEEKNVLEEAKDLSSAPKEEMQNYTQIAEESLLAENLEIWKLLSEDKKNVRKKKSYINKRELVLLKWLKEKWLKKDKEQQLDEKQQFYNWFETNYLENLLAYEKNKKRHFKESRFNFLNRAQLNTFSKIGHLFWYMVTLIVGGLLGANREEIWRYITSQNNIFLQDIPLWVRISSIICLGIILLIILYVFRLFFLADYKEKIYNLNKSKETWLRHSETISNYQKEIVGYLWNTGEYIKIQNSEDKDIMFMTRIIDIWQGNLNKFQNNMKDKTSEENK